MEILSNDQVLYCEIEKNVHFSKKKFSRIDCFICTEFELIVGLPPPAPPLSSGSHQKIRFYCSGNIDVLGIFTFQLLFWEFSFSGNLQFLPVFNFWEFSILMLYSGNVQCGEISFWESSFCEFS
jgi:hypothetical protein